MTTFQKMSSERAAGRVDSEPLALRSQRGRLLLVCAVLGSGVAFLDSTAVNVALPTLGRQLHTGLSGLQWTLDAYLLTLTGFLLLGGALGDRFGERALFCIGLGGFGIASAACGLSPSVEVLIGARAVQGAAGALLIPNSLAMLRSAVRESDVGAAIGAWAGLSGVSTAIGPLLGGWLVDAVSWRAIFWINVPLTVIGVVLGFVTIPSRASRSRSLDLTGAVLASIALGGLTFALITGSAHGWTRTVIAAAVIGTMTFAGFLLREHTAKAPMLPLGLFKVRAFLGANLVTIAVYFALNGALFLLTLELQQVLGYSALGSGASLLPVTLLMLLFSSQAGRLCSRIGARLPLTVGPLLVGAALLLMIRVQPGAGYASHVLPQVLLLGIGLTLTVAPLTTAAMEALAPSLAGVASGVNNSIARLAGLLAVALLPLLAALNHANDPRAFTAGFHRAMAWSAGFCVLGAFAAQLIPHRRLPTAASRRSARTTGPARAPGGL